MFQKVHFQKFTRSFRKPNKNRGHKGSELFFNVEHRAWIATRSHVPTLLSCKPSKFQNFTLTKDDKSLSRLREKVETCPIPSMYGICTYIWLIFMVNVGKYTIHGWYGCVYFVGLSSYKPHIFSIKYPAKYPRAKFKGVAKKNWFFFEISNGAPK